jgi:glycerate kinase
MLDVESKIEQSDIVITGEGKFDQQTLEGKLVKGIIDICNKNNKPLGIICGVSTLTKTEIKNTNVFVKQIKTNKMSEKDSFENAEYYIVKRAEEVISNFVKYFT